MKSIKKKQNTKTIIIILLCIFSLFYFCTIAYSAFSSTMNVTGIGYSRVEADIRVTDFTIKEILSGTSSYQEFSKNTVTSSINIPSNSSISYNLEITNYSNEYFAINNITGLPEGLTYEIKDYNLNDAICDNSGNCNNITKTFELIIKTSNNAFEGDFCLSFDFKILHKINYINFTGNYQRFAVNGSNINIDLSTDSPRYVNLISENKTNYEYENNQLAIYNVTSDIELIAINEEIKNTYSYTGDYQTFTVPYTGMYKIELWGAAGGSSITNGSTKAQGGKGGYTSGSIYLASGEQLYIYVGGKGTNSVVGKNSAGGYNGGGTGTWDNNDDEASGGGGGATDIRYFTTNPTSSELTWNSTSGLKSRIMVAAGGGGSCYTSVGGVGGGLVGGTNNPKATSGSQVTGYKFGQGQSGSGGGSSSDGVGGAGGGYYGGNTDGTSDLKASGTGGSSFISGHEGCNAITSEQIHTGSSIHYTKKYFIDTEMVDGNGYSWTTKKQSQVNMPTQDGTSTMTGSTGNGFAKITLLNITNKSYEIIDGEIKNIIKNSYYEYSNTYQKFTAPYSGIYKVELWGAGGGKSMGSGALMTQGGKGGYTDGEIYLEKNESLYVYVGGKGTDGQLEKNNLGGYNGGGTGTWDNMDDESSGGGGGATDIRFFTSTPTSSDLIWNSSKGLNSRIMVAGAGGGSSWTLVAGAGGGLNGITTNPDAPAGTQTTGYAFGQGQSGSGGGSSSDGIGGGGSGYYGGYTASKTSGKSSGAGGSSFISGHEGCNAIDANRNHTGKSIHFSNKIFTETTMIDGEGYLWTTLRENNTGMPTHDGTSTMTGNTGNGYAKITLIELT